MILACVGIRWENRKMNEGKNDVWREGGAKSVQGDVESDLENTGLLVLQH